MHKPTEEVENYESLLRKINIDDNRNNLLYEIKIPKIDLKYICSISEDSKGKFTGYLNENGEKSGFGIQMFANEDIYIGDWKSGIKDGNGVYFYKNPEIYCGKWTENYKNEFGMYFWLDKEGEIEEVFIGKFKNDQNTNGLCLKYDKFNNLENPEISSSYIYYGGIVDNKKKDANCLLYDFKKDLVYYGKIIDDVALEGYQMKIKNKNIVKIDVSEIDHSHIIRIDEKQYLFEEELNSTEMIYKKGETFYCLFNSFKLYFNDLKELYKELETLKNMNYDLNLESFHTKSNILKNKIAELINELCITENCINLKMNGSKLPSDSNFFSIKKLNI